MSQSINKKLVAGFGICVLLMVAIVGYNYASLLKLEGFYQQALKRTVDMELATDAKHIGQDLYLVISNGVIHRDVAKTEREWAEVKGESLARLRKVAAAADTPEEQVKVREAQRAIEEIIRIFEKEMLPLISNDSGVHGALEDADVRVDKLIVDIDLALQWTARSISEENRVATEEFNAVLARAISFGVAISLIGVLAVLSISTLTIRRIVRTLSELTRAAMELEKGNHLFELKPQSDDEAGVLAGAFRSMSEQVEKRTLDLQASNERLQHEIGEREAAEERLKKAHDELESKVRERTAELSQANELLRQEIALHREAEEALIKNEKILAEAQRIAHVGSWELDLENNVLRWSDEVYRIFGLAPQEFGASYESFMEAVHPDDRACLDECYCASVQHDLPYDLIHRIVRRPDGEIRYVHERCEHNRDDSGRIIRSLGTVHDITDLKQAEEQLIRLSHVVEQSPVSIVITDSAGKIEFVNPQFSRSSGYEPEELTGRTPRILKSGETPPEDYRRLWETITSGNVWRGVFHNKKKDGELFWEFETISPIRNNNGLITHFVAVKEDITERRKLEEQLRQSQKMEAIGQLAGGVAHDFNNLLTVIIGFSNLAEMNLSNDDVSVQYLDQILAAADRATHLTQGLLAFSRKQVINPHPLNLNEVVKGVEKLLARLISEEIELKTRLAERDLIIVADPSQIDQILINLVTNARDAMPGGGVVTIETGITEISDDYLNNYGFGKVGHYAMLVVSDSGAGMDEATRSRVFEPFFTTKEVGKGTGLGLAIVYGIVKQNNGFINVYSEPGRGTTFRIYLPLVPGRAAPDQLSEVQQVALQGTETVLVAEDNREVRYLTRSVLERFGYRVIEAVDGADAIEKFSGNRDAVELVIMDVIMPKMNGKEAFARMSEIRPDLKVLFTSGYTGEVIHEKGIMEEGINFISKPSPPQALLKKVREVLGQADC